MKGVNKGVRTLAATMFLLACSAVALAGGDCTSASVPEPFVLPDGSEHSPGTLTLCVSERYSPVAFMHRTFVDGMPVGTHVSRHSVSEAPATENPYLLFNRGSDRKLRLVGFARPGHQHMDLYALQRTAGIRGEAQPLPGSPHDAPIVIAGLTR